MPCPDIKKKYSTYISAHEIYKATAAQEKIRSLKDYDEHLINSVGNRGDIDNQIKHYIDNNPSLTCYEYCIEFFKIWNHRLEKSNVAPSDSRIQALWKCIYRKYIGRLLQGNDRDKNDIKARISKNYSEAQKQLKLL